MVAAHAPADVTGWEQTGGFWFLETAGPPHPSFSDWAIADPAALAAYRSPPLTT